MDKTFAAIYAVTYTGKSSGYRPLAYKPQTGTVRKQANMVKTYFNRDDSVFQKSLRRL